MHDINFFSQILEVKKKKRQKSVIAISVTGALILIVVFAYLIMELTVFFLNKDISSMQSYLSSEAIMENKKSIMDKRKKIEIMSSYDIIIDKILTDIQGKDFIGNKMLEKLFLTVPREIVVKDLSISMESVSVQGNAPGRQQVAEFLHNLKSLDILSDVHIKSLQKSDGNTAEGFTAGGGFIFDIQCSLKGGK